MKPKQNIKKSKNYKLLIGTLFLIIPVIIAFSIQCPTNTQLYLIYCFSGIGLGFIFDKSIEKSYAKLNLPNGTFGFAGAIALVIFLIIYNPIQYKPDYCSHLLDKTSVSVFVHGKGGKQDIILKQGLVQLNINGEKKTESINEKGQAVFHNLTVGDKVLLNIIFSQPYKSDKPDSFYTIEPNSKIYLKISLQGIGNVRGTVFFNNEPLDSVVVKLIAKTQSLIGSTNHLGDFNFLIPEKDQKDNYEIWVIKKGFESRKYIAYPETGEPLTIKMVKNSSQIHD